MKKAGGSGVNGTGSKEMKKVGNKGVKDASKKGTSDAKGRDYAKKITEFFYEVGQLKNVPRSGWFLCGIKNPESVAEHSFRTAIIAFFLAKKIGANSEKCLLMALFHDFPEARTLDSHKVAQRYVDSEKMGRKAAEEQAEEYPFLADSNYLGLTGELREDKTLEAIVVKDADYLECAMQAKEYLEQGHSNAQDWLDRIGERLKTKEGKEIFREILSTGSIAWWKKLKKME